METIRIDLAPLVDRDLEYIIRIAVSSNSSELKTDKTSQTATITTPLADIAQQIAHRLITCGIGFTYIPR